MDTLTHALSGALLARATAPKDAPPRSLPRRVAAGFFACAAPDLDFVVAFAGPVEYLENHRGVTHSLVLLPLWALAVSWVLAKILREPRGWRPLYGVTAIGLALHIAGDVITSYGTMILAPFSDWRAQIGTTFIIDLWFSGIIAAGLAASAVLRRSRWPAVAASVVLVAYVGFQYLQKEQAIGFGERTARSLGLSGATVNVQPRPVSPFNWTVFVSDAEAHRFAHVNLNRTEPRSYRPGDGRRRRREGARAGSVEFTRDGGLSLVRRLAGLRRHERRLDLRLVHRPAVLYARALHAAVPLRRVPRGTRSGLAARSALNRGRQSNFTPRRLPMSPHLSMSDLIRAPNCSGVPPAGSMP